jgi:hypothetical protein
MAIQMASSASCGRHQTPATKIKPLLQGFESKPSTSIRVLNRQSLHQID